MRLTASSVVWSVGVCALVLADVGTSWAGFTAVPELDPGSAVGGLALIAGAAVLIAERYRRRDRSTCLREGTMKLTSASSMVWTVGVCGLVLAGFGTSWAGISSVPELDPGTAVGGFALVAGAVVLIAERYRRRN
jgi:hypothetical protein